MLTHAELKAKALAGQEVLAAYECLNRVHHSLS